MQFFIINIDISIRLKENTDFFSYNYEIKIFPGICIRKSNKKVLKRIYPSIKFSGKAESIARSFFESDIVLLYDGMAAYKAASTGTPFVCLFSDKKEEFIAESFEKYGAGLKYKKNIDFKKKDLVKYIDSLTFEKRVKMGNIGKRLIDAKGVYRIIHFFEEKEII
jgi:spore coat polysaccharide biosynthesis predicted glycosyltransferase SpsG